MIGVCVGLFGVCQGVLMIMSGWATLTLMDMIDTVEVSNSDAYQYGFSGMLSVIGGFALVIGCLVIAFELMSSKATGPLFAPVAAGAGKVTESERAEV